MRMPWTQPGRPSDTQAECPATNLPAGTRLVYRLQEDVLYDPDSEMGAIRVEAWDEFDTEYPRWKFWITGASDDRAEVKVEVGSDSFAAYTEIPGLFAALADTEATDLKDVQEILDSLGATRAGGY